MRLRALLLPLLLAACAPDDAKTGAPNGGTAVVETAKKPDPVSPPTGVSNIREAHDGLAEQIADLEKKSSDLRDEIATAGDADARAAAEKRLASVEREAKQIIQVLDNLEKASEIGIDREAEEIAKRQYANMRKQLGELEREKAGKWTEIAEIRDILEKFEKGTGKIPPGFTEAELRDRKADLEVAAGEFDEKLDALRKQMVEREKILAAKEIPATERTLHTETLALIQATRKRAAALLEP